MMRKIPLNFYKFVFYKIKIMLDKEKHPRIMRLQTLTFNRNSLSFVGVQIKSFNKYFRTINFKFYIYLTIHFVSTGIFPVIIKHNNKFLLIRRKFFPFFISFIEHPVFLLEHSVFKPNHTPIHHHIASKNLF